MAAILKLVLGINIAACLVIIILINIYDTTGTGWILTSSFFGAAIVSLFFYWLVDVLERIAASVAQTAKTGLRSSRDGASAMLKAEPALVSSNGMSHSGSLLMQGSRAVEPSLARSQPQEIGEFRISTRPNGTATVFGPDGSKHFERYSDALDYAREKHIALP